MPQSQAEKLYLAVRTLAVSYGSLIEYDRHIQTDVKI